MSTHTKATVKLTINGQSVAAQPGETVLTAAQHAGIDIPALCAQEGMAPWAACRLCLVEVEGTSKLQTACTTQVQDGLVVRTDTPHIRARRESYLRMYLSDHNSYCEAPCSVACPTHIDIPAFIAEIEKGDFAAADAIVRRDLPFPGILGRICPAYCESSCRRDQVDEPIAICALHRSARDKAGAPALVCAPSTGKRVAVVGAGVAGLTAAYYLAQLGHSVTVYDDHDEPGGMLRYAIPEFRLPQQVLDDELRPLWEAGVRFVGNVSLGENISVNGLLSGAFDAVFLGIGAWQPETCTIPGAKVAREALDFLAEVRSGKRPRVGKSLCVIGDGPTALDVARTARRLGATVTVLAPHSATEVWWTDADEAELQALGVEVVYEAQARRVKLDRAEKPLAVEYTHPSAESDGKRGRRATAQADARTVILAPGYTPALADLDDEVGLSSDQTLAANPYTGRLPVDGVFAAGDAVSGPTDAIFAVAGSKRAALAIDAWLGGVDLPALENELALYAALPYLDQVRDRKKLSPLAQRLAEHSPVWLKMGIAAEPKPRAKQTRLSVAKQLETFTEVERGLSAKAAQAEAARCLQCTCESNGSCELQRLGIEYGITENELVVSPKTTSVPSAVRSLEPDMRHPFIERDMNKCIACGRCVRVCAEVAGPACYDFSGRGFMIKVDTPYGEALQLADCITCGRCVTACPTGALSFNERALESFKVDESRCIMCHECVDVCPTDALTETNVFEEARKQWHALVGQGSGLAGGHRLCAGCGAPIVVRQVLMGAQVPVVTAAATGCLEVSTTIYPYTSWKNSYIHTAFENVAATLSGVETAYRALKKQGKLDEDVKFIAFGGDGGTYDIGLQSLSGAMERGHDLVYVCYDNEAYMNTGFQRSSATPLGAWTTTSPVGPEETGKLQERKNLTEIMVAHGIPYVAQASPHDPRDLVRKAAKAIATPGPAFLNIISPCPRGWRSDGANSIDLARQAVNTCYWPLFEVENGQYHLTYKPRVKEPIRNWLKRQGRFAHLFKPGNEHIIDQLQAWIDEEWEKLLKKCGETP